MKKFLLTRILIMLSTVFLISLIVFILVQKQPGNPYYNSMKPGMKKTDIERYLRDKGYYDPVHIKYVKWLGQMAKFDMGYSIQYKKPVIDIIKEKLPNTLKITVPSMILSVVLSVVLGIYTAYKEGSLIDKILNILTTIGICIPTFIIAIIFIKFLGFEWKLLPISGSKDYKSFIMPIMTFTYIQSSSLIRYLREFIIKEKDKNYIFYTQTKGTTLYYALKKHAFLNVLISFMTIVLMQLPTLFAGAVITETMFVIPGIGKLNYDAVTMRDYPVIMGILVIGVSLVVISNFLTELMQYLYKRKHYE